MKSDMADIGWRRSKRREGKERKEKNTKCVCEPALSHQDFFFVAVPFFLSPSSLLHFPNGQGRTSSGRNFRTRLVVLLLGLEGLERKSPKDLKGRENSSEQRNKDIRQDQVARSRLGTDTSKRLVDQRRVRGNKDRRKLDLFVNILSRNCDQQHGQGKDVESTEESVDVTLATERVAVGEEDEDSGDDEDIVGPEKAEGMGVSWGHRVVGVVGPCD